MNFYDSKLTLEGHEAFPVVIYRPPMKLREGMFSAVYVSQSLCLQRNASHMTLTASVSHRLHGTSCPGPGPSHHGTSPCSYVNTLVHSRLADMFLFVISLYRHSPPALPPHHFWKVGGWYSTKMPSC